MCARVRGGGGGGGGGVTRSVEEPQLVKGMGVAAARATMPRKISADLMMLRCQGTGGVGGQRFKRGCGTREGRGDCGTLMPPQLRWQQLQHTFCIAHACGGACSRCGCSSIGETDLQEGCSSGGAQAQASIQSAPPLYNGGGLLCLNRFWVRINGCVFDTLPSDF